MRQLARNTLLAASTGWATCLVANALWAQYAPPAGQPRPVQQVQPRSNYAPPQNNYTPPANQQYTQPQPPSAYAQPAQYAPPSGPGVRVAQQPGAVQPAQFQGNQPPVGQPPQQNLQLPQHAPAGAVVPGGPVQVRQQAPQRALFQLNQEQTDQLHRILQDWENESEQIKNFSCPFERWEYDPVFGPGLTVPKTKGYGDLKYVKPDKGRFRIEKLEHFTPGAKPEDPPTFQAKQGDVGEQWVCDGKIVYEYKFDQKKLVCYEIPKEMQGKAIVDGPLPFLFGAKKNQLLARYDMKVLEETEDEVRLDAWPLRRDDAANYQHVEVILSRPRMLPTAMRVHLPNGKSSMVYIFKSATVNNPLSSVIDWFEQPRTPFGWQKVIERAPEPPPAENRQATQPGQPLPR